MPIAPHSKSRQWPQQAGRLSATLYRDDKSSEQSVTGHKPLPTIKPSPGNPFGGATVTCGGEGRRLLAQFTLTTLSAPQKRVEAGKCRLGSQDIRTSETDRTMEEQLQCNIVKNQKYCWTMPPAQRSFRIFDSGPLSAIFGHPKFGYKGEN